jgi:hypothetical protein
MLDDDELDAKMERIFYLSGAMFAMSTNYLIATSLVRHHKEFGKLVSGRNRAAASFRRLGSVQGMKNYILHRFKDDGTASQNLSRKAEKSVTQTLLLKAPRSRISTLIRKTDHHRPTQGKQAALQKDGERRKQPRPDNASRSARQKMKTRHLMTKK